MIDFIFTQFIESVKQKTEGSDARLLSFLFLHFFNIIATSL